MTYSLFISCPGSMEYLLTDEMTALGLTEIKTSPKGVYGEADINTLYAICLWSRIANRVHLILSKTEVNDAKQLYQSTYDIAWDSLFTENKTIAVSFHGKAPFIQNTQYGALVIKDAIVDYFRERGARPSVDKENPNIVIQAFLDRGQLTLSLDLTGYSLHQRGYRSIGGLAPIKENVAAGILIRSGWPALAATGASLLDPCCGSGTFLIEGALIASNTAPGLLRGDQSFVHWLGHDAAAYESVRAAALAAIRDLNTPLVGLDADPRALKAAMENAKHAGFRDNIQFQTGTIETLTAPDCPPGLVVANPPYGERLDDPTALIPLYQTLGKQLATHFQGWEAAILTSNPLLAQAVSLRSHKQYAFYNGAIPVKLYCFSLTQANEHRGTDAETRSESATALFNRLKKNKQHLDKWRKRTGHSCYRLYDAECPEYAFAIDIYDQHALIQEYAPPKEIPPQKAKKRLIEMLQILAEVIDIPRENWILKERKQQKGSDQYQVMDRKQETEQVKEGAARVIINLHDYLDTGLFLDHRLLRLHFNAMMSSKNAQSLIPGLPRLPTATGAPYRFLNCFCYTGTASVQAALGGAITTNVDLSRTYLNWAKDNFRLNYLTLDHHRFIQADALVWLSTAEEKFDVIFLDPPTFSNSKRMETTLDIQRDHVNIITTAMALLAPLGQLYFSTPLRKFKLDSHLLTLFEIKDITNKTIDEDFKYSKGIHHCYLIRHLAAE